MNLKEFFRPTVGKLVAPIATLGLTCWGLYWLLTAPTLCLDICNSSGARFSRLPTPNKLFFIFIPIAIFLISYLISCTTFFLKQKRFLRPTPGKLIAPALAVLLTHSFFVISSVLTPLGASKALSSGQLAAVIIVFYILIPLAVSLVAYLLSCLITYLVSGSSNSTSEPATLNNELGVAPSENPAPLNQQKTARKSFLRIALGVSLLLLPSFGLTIGVIEGKFSNGNNEMVVLLGVPILFTFGLVAYVIRTVRYVRRKEYEIEKLSIRNIGLRMGLLWFLILHVGVLISDWIIYDGNCYGFAGSGRHSCSFLEHFTTGSFLPASIVILYITSWFILFPVVMYIIGFFVDRYTKKQIGLSEK